MTKLFLFVSLLPFVTMSIGYLISLRIKNTSIIDVFWGLSFFVFAVVFGNLFANTTLQFLSVILIGMAGLRLGVFLFWTRIRHSKKDPRYTELEKKWGFSKLKTLGHFYLQASLQIPLCFVLVPLFYETTQMTSLHWIISVVFIIGLLGQTVADWQLFSFKRENKDSVCRKGLWNFSRHPNYFFEWIMWSSLALLSYQSNYIGIALLSPLTIWVITRYMTGPYTEKLSLIKRPVEFKRYQNDVPFILPFIDKKK